MFPIQVYGEEQVRKTVHRDVIHDVEREYQSLCAKAPDLSGANLDNLYNIAADMVRFRAMNQWSDFKQKHNLGVFNDRQR